MLFVQVFDHPELYPKLTGAKRSFGGYPYWLKNELVVDDVLKRLNIPDGAEFNEETLKELVAKISDSKHGKMGQVLWDLHVSSTPLVTSHNVSIIFLRCGKVVPLSALYNYLISQLD